MLLSYGSYAAAQGNDLNFTSLENTIETSEKTPNTKDNSAETKPELNLNNLIVQNAKKYLGVEYQWGGRNTKKRPGLGCMGLVFSAYADTLKYNSWKRFSRIPSKLVKSGELGKPVNDLDGILRKDFDGSKLKPGDVVYFLVKDYELMKDRDTPLAKINNQSYWPWHMGLYMGNNTIIHARPSDKVVAEHLDEIYFDALFVTRLMDKKPAD
jgi:cell wall-associated NlpC family hydrolase